MYTEENPSYIKVYVEESNLPGNKSKYGRINVKTISEEQLLKKIAMRNVGISEEMLHFVMSLICDQTYKELKKGNAVSLCKMGVLSPHVEGAITEQQIKNGRGLSYTLRFTPSKAALKVTEKFRTTFLDKANKSPHIFSVIVEANGEYLNSISKNVFVTIKGCNLKFRRDRHFESEKSGMFFKNKTTGEEFRVIPQLLTTRSEDNLRFYIPVLPVGEYDMYIQKAVVYKDGTTHVESSNTYSFTVTPPEASAE